MKIIYILTLLLFPSWLYAQEGNNLVFGYKSGLNFNTEPPTFFATAGKIYYTSTAYSSKKGDLMFYVNQEKFYNKQHKIVEGSDSFICCVSINGRPSGFLLPDLQDSNNIVLFSVWRKVKREITNDSFSILNNKESGLYINIINTKANNGLGKLIVQNKLMYAGFLDQLTIVRHANQKDYWILCKSDTNTFAAFLYDKQGVHPPVFSYMPKLYARISQNCSIKANTKGNQFVLTNYYWENIGLKASDTIRKFSNFYHLYNFNQSNGSVTLAKVINEFFEVNIGSRSPDSIPYSLGFCSFSPNDSLLYINYVEPKYIRTNYFTLSQYQIYSNNTAGTCKIISSQSLWQLEKMQLAPNGKIFVGSYSEDQIACIENPNRIGVACHFNLSYMPLPIAYQRNTENYSTVFYDYKKVSFTSLKENCNTLRFTQDCDTSFVFYTWYFGDGDSATGASVVHIYATKGNYTVKLKATTPYGYNVWNSQGVFTTEMPQLNFGTYSSVGCQYVAVKFNDLTTTDTSAGMVSFVWDFGDGSTQRITLNAASYYAGAAGVSHVYTKTGVYKVKLLFNNGFCENELEKTNFITILPAPKPGITTSIIAGCTPALVRITDTLTSNMVAKEYDLGNGIFVSMPLNRPLDTTIEFTKAGNYLIRQKLTGTTGCITEDTLTIKLLGGVNRNVKPEIYYVSYFNDSIIEVSWKPVNNATKYQLKCNKETIMLVSNQTKYRFDDKHLKQSNQFQLRAFDTCDNSTLASELSRSIFLRAELIHNEYVIVHWTPYEHWQNGVLAYRLERKIGNREEWEQMRPTNSLNLFTDELTNFDTVTSCEICYRITATEDGANYSQSRSNRACTYLKPTVFVPNAFSPNNDGLNEYFKPYGAGIDCFAMAIYDRWGAVIYQGKSDQEGWDGKMQNGELAPDGVYVYTLQAVNNTKQQSKKIFYLKGTVLLNR